MCMFYLVCALLVLSVSNDFFHCTNAIQYVTVNTTVGEIEGFQVSVMLDGQGMRHVIKYLGIPYAEAPTGVNRFEKPIPRAPFQTKYSALSFPPSCYQNMKTKQVQSEDCLYLNVYVPTTTATKSQLPVMMWIHGGAFVVGSASSYQADAISTLGEVVVVLINYRLGMFGFLRSNDGLLIGNQGLWDQHLALKWVHKNIAGFNGNPNEVTIFGESAGSASVLLQALYPGNTGLFKRVIAESGAALAYWAVTDPIADEVIELGGCKNASDPIFCLRLLSPGDLLMKAQMYKGRTIQYAPSFDRDFLVESPYDIVYGNNSISAKARQFFASLDILTGANNFDGALYLQNVWSTALNETFPDIHLNHETFLKVVIPYTVQNVFNPKCKLAMEQLVSALDFQYTDWSDPNNDTKVRDKLIDLSSDVGFHTPAVNTVRGHSMLGQGRTYLYEFALELNEHSLWTPSYITGEPSNKMSITS